MIRIAKGEYSLGLDSGYWNNKTAKHIFKTGVTHLWEREPDDLEGILFYNGQNYKIGEKSKTITNSKFENLDDLDELLSMLAAVSMELKDETPEVDGIIHARIHLGVGLPYDRHGTSEKTDAKRYYMKCPEYNYEFEGKKYCIEIVDVRVQMQGRAAIAPRINEMLKSSYYIVVSTHIA